MLRHIEWFPFEAPVCESQQQREISVAAMSFWPFTNALNKNTNLLKFLDGIQDLSAVSAQDIIEDQALLQEILIELQDIKGTYNSNLGNFQFLLPQADTTTTSNSDVVLISSSSNENPGNTKDTRSSKLVELLVQPHILDGMLDYLVESVDFFFVAQQEEEENVRKLVDGNTETVTKENANNNANTSGTSEFDAEENDIGTDEDNDDEQESAATKYLENDDEQESEDDKMRRYVQTASDILSIDMWIILNRIIECPPIMTKLWLILKLPNLFDCSPSVTYMVHILDQFMDANSIELLNFLRRQHDLVDTFLSKICIPLLMDFFLRVIQTDKPDSPTGILDTLSTQGLIPKLMDILKPNPSEFDPYVDYIPDHQLFFKQSATTDFLKALITISSNTALAVVLETNIGPNLLTRELVSPKIINMMIHDIILYEPPVTKDGKRQTNKHGINNCVGIIIELIRKNNSDYDLNCGSYSSMLQVSENGACEINPYVMYQWLKDFEQNPPGPRDPLYLGEMLHIFSENLDKLKVLMDIDPIPPWQSQDEAILGFTRFKISELIAELLHCSNMILLNSMKIRKIVEIRDLVRDLQHSRLQKALDDNLSFLGESNVKEITNKLDDISLDEVPIIDQADETDNTVSVSTSHPQSVSDFQEMINNLDVDEDSEDEEPVISPENPFVCDERDLNIRAGPCVGNYFKIKFLDLGLLDDIVKKFTKFPWHNFFHNVVFDLIQQIFNGKLNSYNSFLIVDLFRPDRCDITSMIVNSFKEEKMPRPGYMGHMVLISEEVVKFTSLYKPDLISPVIVEAVTSEEWEWFVSTVLIRIREVYNAVLGSDMTDIDSPDQEGQDYGFDSGAVGYLDLDNFGANNKKPIILGDSSNHDAFVGDQENRGDEKEDGEDDEEGDEEALDNGDDEYENDDKNNSTGANLPELKNINPASSTGKIGNPSEDYNNDYNGDEILESLSGSDSSDDEEEDTENTEVQDEANGSGSNELRRVQRHAR